MTILAFIAGVIVGIIIALVGMCTGFVIRGARLRRQIGG